MLGKRIEKKYKTILTIIFILAIIVRIYNDPTIPYHYDPGKNIVYSRAVLDSFPLFPQINNYFNLGEYYEYQVLFPYTVALLYKITGISLVDLTSWSIIIIGSLIPITTHFMSREIFNNNIPGLISAMLIVVSKIQLYSYMNYYPQIMALMLMSLGFIFIIRYIRTLDRKYIMYSSIISGAIILSSYLASIIYISILVLSLTIFSIIKKERRYMYALISIITGTLALTTFYTLPIISRHGLDTFIKSVTDIISIQKDIPFTNLNVQSDITILKIFGFIVIIILILCISSVIYLFDRKDRKPRLINFNKIRYEHILLSLWVLIPLILIESYKFRPILWVDRYVEFLDISLVIIVGYAIYYIIDKVENRYPEHKYISVLILILIFAYPTYDIIKHQYRFGYWNTPNDLDALNYMTNNIPSDSLVVAPSGISNFWVSAIGGVHVLGGESSQMLGDRFDGNYYSDIIINSPNIEEKMDLIRKFGVQYIYVTIRPIVPLLWRSEYNKEGLKVLTDEKYFDIIYKKEDPYKSNVYIIKVKDELKPKYNSLNIDKNITIYGYVISIITLFIMILYINRHKTTIYSR